MKGFRKRTCSVLLLILILTVIVVPVRCRAESPVLITVRENDWSWVPGEVATFSGLISCQNPELLNGASLRLEILPEPKDEDSGRIVFTAVNDKRIKIRKQSETWSVEDEDLNGDISFEGSWFIPEGSAFFRANLNVLVIGKDGGTLASGNLSIGSGGSENSHSLLRIPVDIGRVNRILAICTAAVCCLAVLRVIVLVRKKQNQPDKES